MQTHRNLLLRSLPLESIAQLGPPELVEVSPKSILGDDGHAYFLESGVATVAAPTKGGLAISLGLIGSEGTSALSAIYGDDGNPFVTRMLVAGTASRFQSVRLASLIMEQPAASALLLHFAHAFAIQVSTTSIANGRSKVNARLARWILMIGDRVGPVMEITHERFSIMLGVRRSGVTIAMQDLQSQGHIRTQRGTLTILNRVGLILATDGAYGFSEAEYERLLGANSLPF